MTSAGLLKNLAIFAALTTIALPSYGMGKKPSSPPPAAVTSAQLPNIPRGTTQDYHAWFDGSALSGHTIKLFENGVEYYNARMAALDKAQHSIYMSTFIWDDDVTGRNFLYKLCQKSHDGVDVRLMLDWKGTRPIHKYKGNIQGCGIKIVFYNPPAWGFDELVTVLHEKLLIIDGQTVFTGGSNIADNYTASARDSKKWYDLDARVDGPVACWFHNRYIDGFKLSVNTEQDIQADPMSDSGGLSNQAKEFYFSPSTLRPCTPVVAATPGARIVPLHYNPIFWKDRPIRQFYLDAIRTSHELIRIHSAYFIPAPEILDELLNARARGVKVQILTNSRTSVDENPMVIAAVYRYSRRLIEAGADIRLWHGPQMIHRKGQVYDGKVVSFGTENFDRHAFSFAAEDLAVTDDPATVSEIASNFDIDFGSSQQLNKESVKEDIMPFSGWEKFISKLLVGYL